MSLGFYADYDTAQLLPAIMITRGTCEDCGQPAIGIQIGWLFWGACLEFEL